MSVLNYNVELITAEDIRALTAYISFFESSVNYVASSLESKARSFKEDCYHHHFEQNIDWGKWAEENQKLVHQGEGIEYLSLEGVGKLLTVHCRADRFSNGHLLSVIENGQILRILKRLETFAG